MEAASAAISCTDRGTSIIHRLIKSYDTRFTIRSITELENLIPDTHQCSFRLIEGNHMSVESKRIRKSAPKFDISVEKDKRRVEGAERVVVAATSARQREKNY